MKTFENNKYHVEIVGETCPFAIWIYDKETKRGIRIDLTEPLIELFGSKTWEVKP